MQTILMPSINDDYIPRQMDREVDPKIQALILHEGRLMVVVTSFDYTYRYSDQNRTQPKHTLVEYLATHVRLYDTELLTSSTNVSQSALIAKTDINGAFSAVRYLNGVAHIVTTSTIDTNDLVDPFEREDYNTTMTEEEYLSHVLSVKDRHIEAFLKSLIYDLVSNGHAIPSLANIDLWAETIAGWDTVTALYYHNFMMNSLVLVHSIDWNSVEMGSSLTVSTSGTFLPTSWSGVYGSNDTIVVAGSEGFSIDFRGKSYTAILALSFEETGSVQVSLATLNGSIHYNYYYYALDSFDIVGKTLRMTTTVQEYFPFDPIDPWTMSSDSPSNGRSTFAPSDTLTTSLPPSDSNIFPPPYYYDWTSENYLFIFNMTNVSSENKPRVMTELSRLHLSNVTLRAIRYFDDIAYAIDYDTEHLLYVLNLTDPYDPRIITPWNTTDFSPFLLSIHDDNTKLLAIEEEDGYGFMSGIRLTVFDVSIIESPFAIHQHYIEAGKNNHYFYNDLSLDLKSTRFNDGHFVVPIGTYNYGKVQERPSPEKPGFVEFTVDKATGIIEEINDCRDPIFSIFIDSNSSSQHTQSNTTTKECFYGYGLLPVRSMVLDDEFLVTTAGSDIIMTKLGTCDVVWIQTISIPDSTSQFHQCY
jgi:Beta propeller domain